MTYQVRAGGHPYTSQVPLNCCFPGCRWSASPVLCTCRDACAVESLRVLQVGMESHSIDISSMVLPVLEGVGSRGVVSALEAGAGWWDVVRVGAWGEMP